MSKLQSGLGKGLGDIMGVGKGKGVGALIPNAYEDPKPQTAINEISISDIEANPWQPRTDFDQEALEQLAASIRTMGVIQPLTLRRIRENKYQIIAGERRFRAAQLASLTTVPAYIRDAGDETMLELALVENIQRQDLNPIEESLSYQRLINECNITQDTLAERVGKSRSAVTNSLRLLKLPPEVQQGLRERKISSGHARAILAIEDSEIQSELYKQTLENGYSVRRIEELVREYKEENAGKSEDETPTRAAKARKPSLSAEYIPLKNQLATFFSADVRLERSDTGKGKITIPFTSDEELERIMALLDNRKSE
ncbi:MAG: ParB/RepB/Spo0J family partition protein [Marinilabiliaceae bacterium]|nr:ParB/RepB/Spo0J family partition protein [Marinilabiliaceae bacterium]